MAGSFYRSPAPGEASFCKEGDKVTKGQTVCIIEAMKLMNEIEVQQTQDQDILCDCLVMLIEVTIECCHFVCLHLRCMSAKDLLVCRQM